MYSESQDGSTNRLDLKAGRTQSIRPRPPATGRGAQPPPGMENLPPELLVAIRLRPVKRPTGTSCRSRRTARISASTGTRRTSSRRTTRRRFIWAATASSSRPTAAATWTASADLTRNIGRNDRPIMGVAGSAPMASKHDGAAAYSNIVTISESPVAQGVVWVGDQRRQPPAHARRRQDVHERHQERAGRSRRNARVAGDGVELRCGDRLRDVRQSPPGRHEAVRVRHARLRTELAVDCLQPARGERQRDHRRSGEPQPALPRHRVRALRLARCGQVVEAVHDGPADRSRRRHRHSTA